MLNNVNRIVYVLVEGLTQVQVRMPESLVEKIDRWVEEGRFGSRSDAIRTIVALYEERERTKEFYRMLLDRSKEAEEKPEILVPLEEIQ